MSLKVGNPQGFISLLKEGYQHFEKAIIRNINACGDLCNIMKTSFGPSGMKKMIVNSHEKLFVTSDAETILSELEIIHPAAKIIAMASRYQGIESGDGTNFTIVFAGELLKKAQELISIGIHPNDIISAYEKAYAKSQELLEGCVEKVIDDFTYENLKGVVKTSISSKQYDFSDLLTDLVIKASLSVMPQNRLHFDVDSIRVVKIIGGSIYDSKVVSGMVFNRKIESLLQNATNAKIAVYTCPLDIGRTETKGTILITKSEELLSFSKSEENLLEEQFRAIHNTGARVLITGATIGELALHFIDRMGLIAMKVPSKFDLKRLCRVFGASPITKLAPPTEEEMGYCDVVESVELGSNKCTIFRQEREKTKISTIILRSGTLGYLDDVERAIDDGVNTIKSLTKNARLVSGAGSTEMEIATKLAEYSTKLSGLDQYGVKKYAECFETVPKSLCHNSEIDASMMALSLYSLHEKGEKHAGVDITSNDVKSIDALSAAIFDVYSTKKSAMHLATDAVLEILRIDNIIMSKPATGLKAPGKGAMDF